MSRSFRYLGRWLLMCLLSFVTPVLGGDESAAHDSSESNEEFAIPTKTVYSEIFCPTEVREARLCYEAAAEAYDDGKADEAISLYIRAIELDSNFCDAMDNLGRVYRTQGNITQALYWYRKSLDILPDNVVAIQNIAVVYRLLGMHGNAIDNYLRMIEIDPDNPEGYYGLGLTYAMQDSCEKAVKWFEISEELYRERHAPYIVDALYSRGLCHFYMSEWEKAVESLSQISLEYREAGIVNYALGVSYLLKDSSQIDLARMYIDRADSLGIEISDELRKLLEDDR